MTKFAIAKIKVLELVYSYTAIKTSLQNSILVRNIHGFLKNFSGA